jgi:hypothetical protein
MKDAVEFDLWLEFEHKEGILSIPAYDPTNDFANVKVTLPDGKSYALNIWTFDFMRRARYPYPYEEGVGEPEEYIFPPDLFVERLDRPTLERIVSQMLLKGQMQAEWLCPNDEMDDDIDT